MLLSFSTTEPTKVTEKKFCDCGAELEYEGIVLTSYPPQYPYTCTRCHKRWIYRIDGTRWEW